MDRNTFITTGSALGAHALLSGFGPKAARAASFSDGHAPPQSNLRNTRSSAKPLSTESDDLTAYAGTWGDAQLLHLLRRTMFGVPGSQFIAAQALGSMSAVVAQLLACQDATKVPLPAKFAPWLDDYPDYADAKTLTDQLNIATLENYKFVEIENWWFDQMMRETLSIRQKMTLMWTNHFVTGSQTVGIAGYMHQYLMTCMANALGNFKDFASAISIDPAMLIYLNGNENFVFGSESFVNENYARELMELFTLGLNDPKTGKPNYVELDVQNSARSLTGWQPSTTAPFIGQFNPSLHDTGTKTFLGQTGSWALSDIINIIFEQGTPPGYTSAYWACQKIYKEFVYYVPNAGVVDAMALLMLDPPSPYNPFDIAPVLEALLSSAHFYDASVVGAQIKSPAQFMGTIVREFALTYPQFNPAEPPVLSTDGTGLNTYGDTNPTITLLTEGILNAQGQELLNPPNVAGWPGGENWLNAGSFSNRQEYSAIITSNALDNTTFNGVTYNLAFSASQYATQIPNQASLDEGQLFLALENLSLAFTLAPIESTSLAPEPSSRSDLIDNAVPAFGLSLPQFPEFQLF
jgi:uncharacterized protein (DUF1800 family)